MIFGRKKPTTPDADDQLDRAADELDQDMTADAAETGETPVDDLDHEAGARHSNTTGHDGDSTADADADKDAADVDEAAGGDAEPDEDAAADEDDPARWEEFDASQDWREDGPFDITEVDLSFDKENEVERLDLGSLVVTPEEDIAIQLQIVEETGQVQALLAMSGNSAIEVAVFAAPLRQSMLAEVREGLIASTAQQGGNSFLAEGPFGTEVRRVVPLQGPDGEQLVHVSRTWLVQGPRWLLRGVVMGEAGMRDDTAGPVEPLFEFFRNVVVQRDSSARVPGDLIPMTLPQEIVEAQQAEMAQMGQADRVEQVPESDELARLQAEPTAVEPGDTTDGETDGFTGSSGVARG